MLTLAGHETTTTKQMVSHTNKTLDTSLLSEILNDHIVSKGNEDSTLKLSRIENLTSLKSNENNNIIRMRVCGDWSNFSS